DARKVLPQSRYPRGESLIHDRACRRDLFALRVRDRAGKLFPDGQLRRVFDLALDDAVRRLDEAVLVDLAVGREGADETDVRTFGRLDRADSAVVAVVHVAHLEAGPIARQSAR